jgi:hypothetical protein
MLWEHFYFPVELLNLVQKFNSIRTIKPIFVIRHSTNLAEMLINQPTIYYCSTFDLPARRY